MYIQEEQLKRFILDSGLVTEKDFLNADEVAKKNKTSVGKELVKDGKLSDDDFRRIEAYVLGIPFVDLKNQKIDIAVLSLIPEPIARNHNILSFRQNKDSLEVAMLDTDDLTAIDFIRKKVNLKILPRLTDTESIRSALLQYQKSLKAEFGDIIQKESSVLKTIASGEGTEQSEGDLKKMAEDLPVVRIVDTLLKHAVIQNASDIHIEPAEAEVLVRYRIDGILRDAMVLPKTAAPGITARIKVLSNLKLDEKRLPQDGRFKIDLDNEKVSFRVSILPVYYGEKTVMRLLRDSVKGFTLEKLGFHGESLERIHWASKQHTGMILTSGPTGSGKTTTLYTVLDMVNNPGVNISTVEDPIEYQMQRVNQTQVKPEIGFTFSTGLRSLLRQDPDIVMVGEIRDNETAALAVNASLTGHLVLSTLHTNSAAGAIPRLLDMEIEPFLLVSTVQIIIGQRLVRRLADSREKYFMTKTEVTSLGKIIDLDKIITMLKEEKIIKKEDSWDKIPFYKPVATPDIPDGYKGRVGIHEVLKMSPTIRELAMKRVSDTVIEKQARTEGMVTMLEDGIFKCVLGLTTVEEVLRVVSE